MGLYFYKLNSPYPEDVTKNCRLTVNEIDSNFLNLKDEDIKSIGFDCESKTITLTRNNGEEMQVDLTCVLSGIDKHFDVKFEEESGCTGSGVLKFVWEEDGNTYESTIKGLITKDNLGNFIMTEAITDGTVIGNGKDESPLGLNPVEQTGHYKPVKDLIDMTNGESLPENKGIGDRYLTKEHIDEYGHLYTIAGVKEIENKLSNGWRIPTKADWDNMLNAIEPCAYRNHDSVHCHVPLGKIAGKELKTTDWPYDPATSAITDDTSYLFDEVQPEEKPINTKGINKFGFAAVPGGFAYEPKGEVQKFGEFASFWTSTQIMPEVDGDYFAKTLTYNMAGVWQSAECPFDLRSLRLVKDYNGSNARETAYIGGKYYEEVLMPSLNTEHGYAIWTKENIDIDVSSINQLRYKDFGDSYNTKSHDSYVINEWTGEDWERKIMPEGAVVVINKQQDCEHQPDTEYRLVGDDLIATDDLVYQRLMLVFTKIIDDIKKQLAEETANRIASDNALSAAIDTEVERAISAETALSGAIQDETSRAVSAETDLQNQIYAEVSARTEADNALSAAIDTEREDRISADTALSAAIDTEIERAMSAESALSAAIDTEVERAISAETALSSAIDTEREERISADTALSGAIQDETSRAVAREDEIESEIPQGGHYSFKTGEILTIPSKTDGVNNIEIAFDGDFGEF